MEAGFIYFLCIFALGFILGTLRTLVLIPRIGTTSAVFLEIPVMLAASWFFWRRVKKRFRISSELKYIILSGASAFAWLMSAEILLSLFFMRQTWAEYTANIHTLHGFAGLLAQIVFALIPVIQRNRYHEYL